MTNKTFKEEVVEEYRNSYKEIDEPSTQARMERVIEITLDKCKERILEALQSVSSSSNCALCAFEKSRAWGGQIPTQHICKRGVDVMSEIKQIIENI